MRTLGLLILALLLWTASPVHAAEPTGPRALVPPRPPAGRAPSPAAAPAARAVAPPAATATAPAPAPTGQMLRVGVEGAYPPFSELTPDGRIKGFDIDIANALCEQLNARCLLVQQSFEALTDDLLARRTDLVVASLSITGERRERYAFTDKYYQVPAKFLARKGTSQAFDNVALKGVRVGVEDNTVFSSLLTDRFGTIVQIVRYPTIPAAVTALGKGEVALVFGDALALDLDVLKTADGAELAFAGPDLVDPDWMGEGVGIALRKEDTGLRDQLSRAIAQLRANGRYQAIDQRYFDFDIYGGTVLPSLVQARAGARPLDRTGRDLPRLIDGPVSRPY